MENPKEEPKQELPQLGTKEFVTMCESIFSGKPKQETQGYICPQTQLQCDDECCVSAEDCHIEAGFDVVSDYEPPKQETLEEAAERLWLDSTSQLTSKNSFIQGAKWMQETMYSEEDLREAFRQGMENMDYSEIHGWSSKLTEQEWFQDFKKK